MLLLRQTRAFDLILHLDLGVGARNRAVQVRPVLVCPLLLLPQLLYDEFMGLALADVRRLLFGVGLGHPIQLHHLLEPRLRVENGVGELVGVLRSGL